MADIPDRAAAFIRYAADRKRVASARGAVVKLCRWHRPMLHKQHAEALPPLRNLYDARAWAAAVKPGTGSADFVLAMTRMWREFVVGLYDAGEVDDEACDAALAAVDLDEGEKWKAARWAAVTAWAETFGDKPVTSAQLRRVRRVRDAVGSVMRPDRDPDAVVSGQMVASFVRVELAKAMDAGEFGDMRIGAGPPDRHNKLARFVLTSGAGAAVT